MEKRGHSIMPGLILIVLGVLIILHSSGTVRIDWGDFWIYIIILLGLLFWLGFLFDRRNVGLLMPGSVLLTIGLVFLYAAQTDWSVMGELWPFFILAPAFGFYAMFLFGERERGLLVPAGILTVIGVIFLLQSLRYSVRYAWAIGFIVIGALLLFRGLRGKSDDGGASSGPGHSGGFGSSRGPGAGTSSGPGASNDPGAGAGGSGAPKGGLS
jgi:uncharacterized membrane protein YgcG